MLKINDSVRVKPGIKDPDNEQFDLGGWQGRIIEIDDSAPSEVLVTIAWDSQTLREMPKQFVEGSIRDGLDFSEMTLLAEEVELTEARDKAQDSRDVIQKLEAENNWAEFDEQGKRIKAMEDACENEFDLIDLWFEHLEKTVKLPIKARYIGEPTQNLRPGVEILINGFVDADYDYGVLGSATYQNRRVQVPLCDVEVLNSNKNTEALEDYIVWFVNR